MSSLTQKEIKIIESIVKDGCPKCKKDEGIMAQGYQWCTSNDITITIKDGIVSFDLSGDYGQDWIVDPVFIWCETCKTVWLDRRNTVADSVKNLTIRLGDENPTYPFEDWIIEVTNKNTLLGYWEWVVHKIDANEV